jgi:hypothetical protein
MTVKVPTRLEPKLWIGTGILPNEVKVYFIKPVRFVLDSHGVGAWGPGGVTFNRETVKAESPILPRHGSDELLEIKLPGNGRLP